MTPIRINLLPHREQRKTRQRQALIASVAGVIGAGVAIAVLGHLYIANQIDNQASRNELLRQEIAKLDAQIKEIEQLKDKTNSLLNRKKVVEGLQNNRSELVHLFDELARRMPDGVYLTSIKQSGNQLDLQGMAQSSARVSSLMQNLQGSTRFDTPTLIEVRATTKDNFRVGQFSMNVKQITPTPPPSEGEKPQGQP